MNENISSETLKCSFNEILVDKVDNDTYLPKHVKEKSMHENEKIFEVVSSCIILFSVDLIQSM